MPQNVSLKFKCRGWVGPTDHVDFVCVCPYFSSARLWAKATAPSSHCTLLFCAEVVLCLLLWSLLLPRPCTFIVQRREAGRVCWETRWALPRVVPQISDRIGLNLSSQLSVPRCHAAGMGTAIPRQWLLSRDRNGISLFSMTAFFGNCSAPPPPQMEMMTNVPKIELRGLNSGMSE